MEISESKTTRTTGGRFRRSTMRPQAGDWLRWAVHRDLSSRGLDPLEAPRMTSPRLTGTPFRGMSLRVEGRETVLARPSN